ncbi:MAG: DEAD/DEAH box helicase [Methanimicrococcus sp.]|nr:DEAD/DEAH box helicase [Methanimicrococcus sp.]MCL2141936.1 DEAD/DEAH box helicase [Methanimicrococcus sp.]
MTDQQFIKHPLILENVVEQRMYQLNIVSACTKKNSLVVLPTSLGKTIVALLIMVMRLERVGGKVLLLSPTKPLVQQHYDFFSRVMKLEEGKVKAFTGSLVPEKRKDIWLETDVIISTPQVIENDLMNGRISLKDVSCIVFDEAHRTVGNYAYTYIAEKYTKDADNPLILGITASPGSEKEKIDDVCQTLCIENVVVKTEDDPDIKPYVHKKDVEWLSLELPKELAEIRESLKKILDERFRKLVEYGYPLDTRSVTKKDLLALQDRLAGEARSEAADPNVYNAVSVVAEIMKIEHAVELVETQGAKPLLSYLTKMDEEAALSSASKAVKRLVNDLYFRQALNLTEKCEREHPKFYAVQKIVSEQLTKYPDSKIIVFTNFRDTANTVKEALEEIKSVRPVRFVGQGSRYKDKGLTQKQQTEIIDQFRAGEYNVLIATSVAEEGLDIPATDMVLFYEPVPSEIRSIQRKGRTGRFQTGRVIVLITKGTRDEFYRWSSQSKEKKMLSEMKSLQKSYASSSAIKKPDEPQKTFFDFEREFKKKYENVLSFEEGRREEEKENEPETETKSDIGENFDLPAREKAFSKNFTKAEEDNSENEIENEIENKNEPLKILADVRELKSGVLRHLESQGVFLKTAKLEVADYVISDEMAVERKSAADFSASLIDGKRNLFSQLVDLSRAYKKPALIVEGEEEIGSKINPNAIKGALLSIEMDLKVSVFYTKNEEETALLLKMMAKREQIDEKKSINLHGKKPAKTTSEQQEYLLSSISGVGPNAARLLLNEFGSLTNIFNATEEDLCKIKGIGKKTAQRIRDVMEAEYKK